MSEMRKSRTWLPAVTGLAALLMAAATTLNGLNDRPWLLSALATAAFAVAATLQWRADRRR